MKIPIDESTEPPRKARRLFYDEGWVLLIGLIAFGAAALGLFWMVLPSGPAGFLRLAAMAGVLAGYLVYDMTHYFVHHGKARGRWGKFLKSYHLAHHHKHQHRMFGVSQPFWDFVFRTGPLTMPPSQAGAFARSDPAQPTPNIEWHVQPLSLDKFGDPLHAFPAITPSVCNLRPSSRGWVRIKSPDPAAYPEIKLNYLETAEDRRVAVDGMRFTRRIMAAKALAKYEPEEYRPGLSIQDDRALERAAGALGTTIFHPVGTCKMGSDPLAVVDEELRVHGIGRLRVIDASIFPRITSGNTNAPTYVVAEKGARAILKPDLET